MSNEARSHSHRWLFEPDRLLVHEDGTTERVRGSLVRQRLTTSVKPGWRPATWDDLDPTDPTTDAAFRYRAGLPVNDGPALSRAVVFRNGIPDPGPAALVPAIEDEPSAEPVTDEEI